MSDTEPESVTSQLDDKIPQIRDILSSYIGFPVTPSQIYKELDGYYIVHKITNTCCETTPYHHNSDTSRIVISSNKAYLRCLFCRSSKNHKDIDLSSAVAHKLYNTLTDKEPKSGYIYCFATPSMPGIVKLGQTTRTPEIRLKEANAPDMWKPPHPYHIIASKAVSDPRDNLNRIRKELIDRGYRIPGDREFFKVSEEAVTQLFEAQEAQDPTAPV